MLSPRQDRIDYSTMLMPPKGMVLKQAVGTTYSLDLDALLSIPLALGLGQEPTETLRRDKVFLLTALRRVAAKLTVFCHRGATVFKEVSVEAIGMHALLEDSVVPISLPKNRSFHPKIWVLWYEEPRSGDQKIRVMVMSRNLTFDRSWDAAVCMEGNVGEGWLSGADGGEGLSAGRRFTRNKPLMDFIRWLGKQQGTVRMTALLEALEKTELKLCSGASAGSDYEFFPMGIFGYMQDKIVMEPCQRQAVCSPFLSANDVLKYARLSPVNRTLLFSRADQIAMVFQLKPDIRDVVDPFTVSDQAFAGGMQENYESEKGEVSFVQDLHAKIYVREFSRQSEMWIGSANLSHMAFHGNVEFMVRLYGRLDRYSVDRLQQELIDESNLFEPWTECPPTELSIETHRLERKASEALRGVLEGVFTAQVQPSGESGFRLNLSVREAVVPTEHDLVVKVSPLGRDDYRQLQNGEHVFEPFQTVTLTQYYVIRIQVESLVRHTVIKVDTTDMPADREQAIVANIIKNRDDFLRHLTILLADDERLSEAVGELEEFDRLYSGKGKSEQHSTAPLFEQLLRMTSREPYRLGWIEQDVAHLAARGDAVVPPEFWQLWQSFRPYVKRKGARL